MKLIFVMALGVMMVAGYAAAYAFDHSHSRWNELLKEHVVWINDGVASEVDYAGFKKDRDKLQAYLKGLSDVSKKEFDGWSKDRQLAFLINAYNGFTIEYILTKYPDIASIKELGSLFQSAWKRVFFTLLGEKRHLDWIEHEMIREPGVYDEPRIHAAVNCASIGCPALRDEAFVPDRLEAQMEDNMRRFLRDSSRNRYNPKTGRLEVSKVFDWFRVDFESGYKGIDSLAEFFSQYAELLADDPQHQQKIRNQEARISFLSYDWGLNDISS